MVTENELAAQLSQQAGAIVVAVGGLIVLVLGSVAAWARNGIPKWLDARAEDGKAKSANDTEARKVALQREQINNELILRLTQNASKQDETINVLTTELRDAQTKINVLRTDTTALTDATASLKRQLEEANNLTKKLREEIKTLTDRLAASERENADLKKQLESRQKELDAQRQHIADRRRQITAVEHRSENGNGNAQQVEGEKPSG